MIESDGIVPDSMAEDGTPIYRITDLLDSPNVDTVEFLTCLWREGFLQLDETGQLQPTPEAEMSGVIVRLDEEDTDGR